MLSIITLPTDFAGDISANASTIITDLSPFITLIVGVLLGILVIGVLIHFIKK